MNDVSKYINSFLNQYKNINPYNGKYIKEMYTCMHFSECFHKDRYCMYPFSFELYCGYKKRRIQSNVFKINNKLFINK